jgi:type VI secretion system protein ImpM
MAGVGAFGKMPSLGDFFRIHAAPSFVDPWDAWLQQGMVDAQHALGARWQSCYMSAPIWRFTVSAGLAGPTAMQGVLMPSVDRVGRTFPLTLIVPLPREVDPMTRHLASGAFFTLLEDIALKTLDGDTSREALERQLSDVATPSPSVTAAVAPPQRTSPQKTSQSIWSAELEQGPLMMTCEGLPVASEICSLFDLEAPVWKIPTTQPEATL